MEVRILKGTDQIGGCVTEITSNKGTKIIIDYGEDLEDSEEKDKEKEKQEIEGLTKGKAEYKAVFITHSHGDHIGLITDILKNIPVYVEEKSAKIFEIASAFTSKKSFEGNLKTFKFEEEIKIDDLTIKPYRTDHSAYNSAMFLIENDGKKVLHLGDYRSTGYSGEEFYHNLRKIDSVDLLITEGTLLTRDDIKPDTELELKEKAKEIFKQYKQVFILQASTNLDRLKSFHDAAMEVEPKKNFILDISSANILKAIDDSNYQYLKEEGVTTWLPNAYIRPKPGFYTYKEEGFYEKYIKPFDNNTNISKDEVHEDYVMLVKTSMFRDIENNLKRYRDNAVLIYSMWNGYKDEKRPNTEKTRNFIEELKKLNIKFEYLHTSGHADLKTIIQVCKIVKSKKVIGIHTEDNTKLEGIIPNYVIVKDGEIIEV